MVQSGPMLMLYATAPKPLSVGLKTDHQLTNDSESPHGLYLFSVIDPQEIGCVRTILF